VGAFRQTLYSLLRHRVSVNWRKIYLDYVDGLANYAVLFHVNYKKKQKIAKALKVHKCYTTAKNKFESFCFFTVPVWMAQTCYLLSVPFSLPWQDSLTFLFELLSPVYTRLCTSVCRLMKSHCSQHSDEKEHFNLFYAVNVMLIAYSIIITQR